MNSYKKVKAASKEIVSENDKIHNKVLNTLKVIADTVGSTLGPSGRPVLIERQEYGLPNILTKDGVTVFRNLGFRDPVSQAIMESARDAANRTVTEAGDGTTTATVLSYSLVSNILSFSKKNPTFTPQKIVREVQNYFNKVVAPCIEQWKTTQDTVDNFGELLHNVAKVSANGDVELADIVMECFDLSGDKGAIVLTEQSGPAGYQVERIEGYPVEMGYEDSVGRYSNLFINDRANGRIVMENPVFILSQAPITEIQTLQLLLEKIGKAWAKPADYGLEKFSHNVVVVAPGFSDAVLGSLAVNWPESDTMNVLTMNCPKTIVQNSEMHFLEDLSAVTGATIFNPLTKPVGTGELTDVGYGVKAIEMSRYRTMIIGICEQVLVDGQIEMLTSSLATAESKLDNQIIEDRIARLNGGICKLKIIGPSTAEVRERKDRAEDAIAAVRGAIKHGVIPGGCWTLMRLAGQPTSTDFVDPEIFSKVIAPSMMFPFMKILENAGYSQAESINAVKILAKTSQVGSDILNVAENKWGDAFEQGVLDSVPAVLESIRNSFSIASNLGTIGGIIVFERDDVLEREEASAVNHFAQSTGMEGQV